MYWVEGVEFVTLKSAHEAAVRIASDRAVRSGTPWEVTVWRDAGPYLPRQHVMVVRGTSKGATVSAAHPGLEVRSAYEEPLFHKEASE